MPPSQTKLGSKRKAPSPAKTRKVRLKPQKLSTEEVDDFLHYMFEFIAKRPLPISLREGAAVAHFLKAQAIRLESGHLSLELDELARTIWCTVFQVSRIQTKSKEGVLRFIRRHRETYLARYDVDRLINELESIEPSKDPHELSASRSLMSKHMASAGDVNPYLSDDLSDRIYGAYYALRNSSVRNARTQIATALNRQKIERGGRSRRSRSPLWDGDTVYERVRRFEAALKKQESTIDPKTLVPRLRLQFANKWIGSYKWKITVDVEAAGSDHVNN